MTLRPGDVLPPSFFERDALACARDLVGAFLVHGGCAGRVLETEAYREHGDPACHLFTRPSARAFAGEHPPGTAYVYLNYGVHWLANVLCRDADTGEAGFVLFRALEPVEGVAEMEARRGTTDPRKLCSGPGKLTAALAIGPDHHGRPLTGEPGFSLRRRCGKKKIAIATDRRVGISAARDFPWRFLLADHPGVSVPSGKAS